MSGFLELDGSAGEGGGQILRTALGLSLVTGQGFRLNRHAPQRVAVGNHHKLEGFRFVAGRVETDPAREGRLRDGAGATNLLQRMRDRHPKVCRPALCACPEQLVYRRRARGKDGLGSEHTTVPTEPWLGFGGACSARATWQTLRRR